MARKENGQGFAARLRGDYEFRTRAAAALSMAASAAYAAYNGACAALYRTAWGLWVGVYYLLLTAIRAALFFGEMRFCRKAEEQPRRGVFYAAAGTLLFAADIALIGPIVMMMQEKRPAAYSSIPAIAAAAYTALRVTLASRNFVKTRRAFSEGARMLRAVSFSDALASVLTLQYILVMTFGEGVRGGMRVLCACSGFALWAAAVLVSAFSLAHAINAARARKGE